MPHVRFDVQSAAAAAAAAAACKRTRGDAKHGSQRDESG